MAIGPTQATPDLTREEIAVLGSCTLFGGGLALFQAVGAF